MAADVGGRALISAFVQDTLDRLNSRDVLDYLRGKKIDKTLLNRLNTTLRSINAVADDAEQKQFTDLSVKAWLDEVKDAVFEADDLLDELHTLISQLKLETGSHTRARKVRNFFSVSASSFGKKIESRMKKNLYILEDLAITKHELGLTEAIGHGVESVSQKFPSISLVDESVVYGRDDDKEIILDWLISDAGNDNPLSIITIVGMGGLGKTTLAQLLYNDLRVSGHFHTKVWVCVSDNFDVLKISRAILQAITKSADDSKDLEVVLRRLKEVLTGKRFLLVLDDVWNEDPLLWVALQTPLNCGLHGSKVLVTTRSMEVSLIMQSNKIHRLGLLHPEYCWKLFTKHAFQDESFQLDPAFKEIGSKVVEKCAGLPLVLKTMGGLLCRKTSILEWQNVLDLFSGEIWARDHIIPALLLSYHHLPSHLKRCFAYCSLFPSDYVFEKQHLIELWMAQNFLQCPQQGMNVEEVGEKYFNDLVSRSFFQQSRENKSYFVMHELLNELARYVSRQFCVRLEDEETQNIPTVTRHVSFETDYIRSFKGLENANRLRTFLPLSSAPKIVIDDLISNCKLLRVLSLSRNQDVIKLPKSIGDLKHLRHLDISHTRLSELPSSICLLYNLQIMKLSYCHFLKELPLNFHKLVNLRSLDLVGTKLSSMPMHLGKLKNLQVLSSFYVGKGREFGIQQLSELNPHGTLSICELQNIVNPLDALSANLINKIHLVNLEFEWSEGHVDSQKEAEVLERLQPSKYLKELSIRNYGGTRFPDWFGDNSLSNVVSLELSYCKYCVSLPSLGLLPSLKKLSVIGLHGIEVIGAEFYGSSSSSFVSLETLIFENMIEWRIWDCNFVTGAFPCLQELSMKNCPRLIGHLPEQLPCSMKLVIFKCPQLVASVRWAPAIVESDLVECGKVQFDYHPSTWKDAMGSEQPSTSKDATSKDAMDFVQFDYHPSTSKDAMDFEQPSNLKEATLKDVMDFVQFDYHPSTLKDAMVSPKIPPYNLESAASVYGRQKEKDQIVDFLLDTSNYDDDNANKNTNISVLGIVGPGGIGKTTLAQVVYEDQKVSAWFELRVWVTLPSHQLDAETLAKIMLGILKVSFYQDDKLQDLMSHLQKSLSGRKLLLVLDSCQVVHQWEILQTCFGYAARGSVIILTTVMTKFAFRMLADHVLHLSFLSMEHCWSIFFGHCFGIHVLGCDPKLETLGKRILNKCRGVPLAAKMLGSLLHQKDYKVWEEICRSQQWDSASVNLPTPFVRICYLDLPAELKRCITFLAKFPKGYKFQKRRVVLLWMAQGLIQQESNETMEIQRENNETMEELGNEYFDFLIARSFLLRSHCGDSLDFTMHDMIHDVALSDPANSFPGLGGNDKQNLEETSFEFYGTRIEERIPMKYDTDIANKSRGLDSQSPEIEVNIPINTEGTVQDTFDLGTQFETLRILDASQLMKLPTTLHSLRIEGIHSLESLQDVLMNCTNLFELYVIDCSSLKYFTDGKYPTSLRTLYVNKCRKLEFLQSDKKMHSFDFLEHLLIGSSYDHLKSFPLTLFPKLKILFVWDCPNLDSLSMDESQNNNLSLESLEIRNCSNLVSFPTKGLRSPSLRSFSVSNCKNLRSLPNHMTSLTSLHSVFIVKCPELESLPPGGLPSCLKLLSIAFCDKLMPQKEWNLQALHCLRRFEIESGCMGMKSFPERDLFPSNLNSLYISKLPSLEFLDFNGLQQLTDLEKLEINCCEKLQSLPEVLPSSLNFLCIKECSILTQKLLNRAGPDWLKIAHICNVQIDNSDMSRDSAADSFASRNRIPFSNNSKRITYDKQ